ncbi:hypothetical protein D3C72_2120430 [compost metagenome]
MRHAVPLAIDVGAALEVLCVPVDGEGASAAPVHRSEAVPLGGDVVVASALLELRPGPDVHAGIELEHRALEGRPIPIEEGAALGVTHLFELVTILGGQLGVI